VRHGTCFRRRLSAHHAGAAPRSAVAELGFVRRHRASPVKQISANQFIPFGCFLASIAFVLPLALFAISSSLSLRSFRTPWQSTLGYSTHVVAIVIIVLLPSLLALRPFFLWRWTVVAVVAAAAGFALSLHFLPHLRAFAIFTNPSAWVFFLVAFVLMVASALLAVAARASVSRRRWLVVSCEAFAYLCLLAGAFVFTSIPLYVE